MSKRKPRPTKIYRIETYNMKGNHTTQTFNPKQGEQWKPRAPYADWAPEDSYSEVWVGEIIWTKLEQVP